MLKTKYILGDCIQELEQLGESSVDLIITSPPYNLKNKGGDIKIDSYNDNLSNDDYAKWQLSFLNACNRVLKKHGAMFYNHKNRYEKNKVITPYSWVLNSKFNLKQVIIWNRLTTADREASKYAPLDELIFWLYKDKTFRLKSGAQNFTNIWNIKRPSPKDNWGHKATFPYELIYRIINSLDLGARRVLVIDPFCGSGTTGQVAFNLHMDFIMIDNNQQWIDVCKEKSKIKNDYFEEIPIIKNKYKKENNNE